MKEAVVHLNRGEVLKPGEGTKSGKKSGKKVYVHVYTHTCMYVCIYTLYAYIHFMHIYYIYTYTGRYMYTKYKDTVLKV